jgi:hypothetical protein
MGFGGFEATFELVCYFSYSTHIPDAKQQSVSSPFPMSEKKLYERLKHAKPLTREQFMERINEIKSGKPKEE